MPKVTPTRKISGSPRTPNKCNYCKNHVDTPVFSIGHKNNCPYKSDEHLERCEQCQTVRGNTVRMQKYRRHQAGLASYNFEVLKIEILRPEDKEMHVEMLDGQEIIEASTSSQLDAPILKPHISDNNDLTLAAFPLHFPKYILFAEIVKDFRKVIEKIILNMPETEEMPKFISSPYTAGFWKVECFNEYSRDWFVMEASKLTYTIDNVEHTLQVRPIRELPNCKFAVQMSGDILEDYQILKFFERYNRDIGLETSRWDNLECISNKDGYMLCLEIDPISFEKIKENQFQLSFGMERVHFQTIISS